MKNNSTVAFVVMCTALCFFYLGRSTAVHAPAPIAPGPEEVCDFLDDDCGGEVLPAPGEEGELAFLIDASGAMDPGEFAAIAKALAIRQAEADPEPPAPTIVIIQVFICEEQAMPLFPPQDGATTVHEI